MLDSIHGQGKVRVHSGVCSFMMVRRSGLSSHSSRPATTVSTLGLYLPARRYQIPGDELYEQRRLAAEYREVIRCVLDSMTQFQVTESARACSYF